MKNNINLKFFVYSLKKNFYFILFNLIVFILTFIIPILMMYGEYSKQTDGYINFNTKLNIISYALMVYTFIIPVKSYEYLSKKRTIDAYYSLPIERKNVGFINLLSDVISVLIPFTVVYFTGSFITFILYKNVIYFYYLILYILLVTFFIICIVINTFFFTRCHRCLDGVVNMLMSNYVFAVILSGINKVLDLFKITYDKYLASDIITSSVFLKTSRFFNNLISLKYMYLDYLVSQSKLKYEVKTYEQFANLYNKFQYFPTLILVVILSCVCIVLFKKLSKKYKPENAEERSKSWFSLKLMTPVIFTGLAITLVSRNFSTTLTFYIIIVLLYVALTVLEFQTFKIPLYRVLMLVGMFLIMLLGFYIAI